MASTAVVPAEVTSAESEVAPGEAAIAIISVALSMAVAMVAMS
ncbi:MAG TPA: hypothetical protein VGV37_06045 [Aliidongia sp.]|nr:hypothetical protein [Aliidongia sp.]HEV2674085.1 hypothetical protein [Aliidongia sp.]